MEPNERIMKRLPRFSNSEAKILMIKLTTSTGGYFSVFALDECYITESGCKYPLNRAKLERRRPYGVSNETIADHAEITVEGVALLVTSKR